MSIYIHRSHNVTVLLYHLVLPTKYRRLAIDDAVDKLIKDHVHFLVQSVPTLTVARIITIIKSITARHVFDKKPELKKELWGSSLWTSGYYASTVGKHGNETAIRNYVKGQGRTTEYVPIHKDQLRLL